MMTQPDVPPSSPLLNDEFVSQQVVGLMKAARERQPLPQPVIGGSLEAPEHLTLKAVRQLAEIWHGAGPDDLLVMLPGHLSRDAYVAVARMVRPAQLWVSCMEVEKPPSHSRPHAEKRYYLHACEPTQLVHYLAQATQMKIQLLATF